MKRFLMLVLMLFVALACMAAPDVLAQGNREVEAESMLPLQVDMAALAEAVQPYLDAWGMYVALNTHICKKCEGVALFLWADANDQIIQYVRFEYFDGTWVVVEASEPIENIPPGNTS